MSSVEQLAESLRDLIRRNVPVDEINEWINVNSSESSILNKNSKEFTRLLTATVLELCIDDRKRLNADEMTRLQSVLQNVIDSKVDRELQALYAIQRLIVKLEHPQGN